MYTYKQLKDDLSKLDINQLNQQVVVSSKNDYSIEISNIEYSYTVDPGSQLEDILPYGSFVLAIPRLSNE
jgi:hypothetical protein